MYIPTREGVSACLLDPDLVGGKSRASLTQLLASSIIKLETEKVVAIITDGFYQAGHYQVSNSLSVAGHLQWSSQHHCLPLLHAPSDQHTGHLDYQ